jgi:hypothetical protein
VTPISTKLSHRQSFALSRARPSRTKDSQKRFTFLCQNQSITLGLLCKQRTSPKHSTTDLTDADPLHVTGPPHFRSATQHKEYDAPPRLKVNITQSMTGFQPFPVNNFLKLLSAKRMSLVISLQSSVFCWVLAVMRIERTLICVGLVVYYRTVESVTVN